ncbi:hypothetical protein KY361_05800 [Candidatus Woesearchaeota archaeon]|nr:hypothetical protein [Candidatus Woesearchaeota archaeon]
MAVSGVLAVIFAVVILAKLVAIFRLKPKKIMGFAEKMYSKPMYITIGFLAAIVILGWLLLMELSIAQIMAASLFGIMVYGLALVQYKPQLFKLFKVALRDKDKMWLPMLIWLVLAVWVLIAVF